RQRDRGAHRVGRIGAVAERVGGRGEAGRAEGREADQDVVHRVDGDGGIGVPAAAVGSGRAPVGDPAALHERAGAVELDPLDGCAPRVARLAAGGETDRLRVVDVAVAEDGVADSRVFRVDRVAATLREEVAAAG